MSTKASAVDQPETQKYTPQMSTFIFVKTIQIGVYELWVERLSRQKEMCVCARACACVRGRARARVCVRVALGIQHAVHTRHIVICGPLGSIVFFHSIS